MEKLTWAFGICTILSLIVAVIAFFDARKIARMYGDLQVENKRHLGKLLNQVRTIDLAIKDAADNMQQSDNTDVLTEMLIFNGRLGDITRNLRIEVLHLMAKAQPDANAAWVDQLIKEGNLDLEHQEDEILRGFLRADGRSQD